MKWITRERPKIDRIACPWLIRRFVDNEAQLPAPLGRPKYLETWNVPSFEAGYPVARDPY